ncbi:cysteine hydrolase family protein [Aquabacter cavernae]|uniref:cysteine hydrolase family protein n=1 Tax=Aquabacter cavernae TaxID=2496029 RepID=UPI000F8CDB79|nr:isochorismatase family cysteine hydrolase [Aquabacter cavernae]
MTTAFVALDFINDIVDPAGKIAGSAAEIAARGTLAKAHDALAAARERGWLTVLVRVGFAEGYAAAPKTSPIFGRAAQLGALKLGGWGTEFHPALGATPSDAVILKPRVSAFYASGLEALLRVNHVERLVVCGVSTAWAVQATVRDGHDRDYEMVVVEDACAAADAEEHAASLHLLSRIARMVRAEDLAGL